MKQGTIKVNVPRESRENVEKVLLDDAPQTPRRPASPPACLPTGNVSKVGTALMAKDDDDGKTVLMLAASAGNPEVLELVASRLPRAQVS